MMVDMTMKELLIICNAFNVLSILWHTYRYLRTPQDLNFLRHRRRPAEFDTRLGTLMVACQVGSLTAGLAWFFPQDPEDRSLVLFSALLVGCLIGIISGNPKWNWLKPSSLIAFFAYTVILLLLRRIDQDSASQGSRVSSRL